MASQLSAPQFPRSLPSISHQLSSPLASYLPLCFSPPNWRKHSLFNAGLSSSSPSNHSRKVICTPMRGKFVREDYLVKKLSAQEIQDLIRSDRKVPVVIDFYATWCGPCILMAQELETLAVECESNAIIVKVDTDEEYEFARDMQVRGLPTLFFISPDPNKDSIRTEGLIPLQLMRDILSNNM